MVLGGRRSSQHPGEARGGTGREDAGCPPGGSDRSLPRRPAELQRRGAGGRRALGFALFSFSVWLPRDGFGVKLLEASGAGGSAWGAWAQPASMLSSRSGWSRRKRRVGHGTCRKKPRVRPIRASAVRVNIGGCFGGNIVLNLIPVLPAGMLLQLGAPQRGLGRPGGSVRACPAQCLGGFVSRARSRAASLRQQGEGGLWCPFPFGAAGCGTGPRGCGNRRQRRLV